jgi:dTDP-4-dehydrorhamnose reductase
MKWLITGLNGSLAPQVARVAGAAGVEVLGWNRSEVDPNDAPASAAWLDATRPDAIVHLAMGSADWAGRLAQYGARRAVPFLFTSTAMVFHHEPDGPHRVDARRNAQDDYGRYKIACEDAVRASNPNAMVVRIGWQIDPQQAGNNMLMALDQWQMREGRVAASRAWKPACSFMADTAAALIALVQRPTPGVVHLDSNADEGHTFASIVTALKTQYARDAWILHEHEDYRHDQRLAGGAARMPPLSARLPQGSGSQ